MKKVYTFRATASNKDILVNALLENGEVISVTKSGNLFLIDVYDKNQQPRLSEIKDPFKKIPKDVPYKKDPFSTNPYSAKFDIDTMFSVLPFSEEEIRKAQEQFKKNLDKIFDKKNDKLF